jgi:acetyltransferase-like isoleucine patch superfamily enzyme
VVEDEVWICAGVIILSGVTVGRGAVIAAGSVVASDVKPLCLYGGSPAKLIRELENDIK